MYYRDFVFMNIINHGHLQALKTGKDELLDPGTLSKAAVQLCRMRCRILAPSDMMDARIGHASSLDTDVVHTLIMAYSVKYASALRPISEERQILHRPLVTEKVTRWISETAGRPFWRLNWTWRKVLILLW